MGLTVTDLREFLAEELAIDCSGLTLQSPLFSSGLVDSFSLVSLLSYLESTHGFVIDPEDVTLENFDSLERILAYASRQRSLMSGAAG